MSHDPLLSKIQAATNLSEPSPLHSSMREEIDRSLRVPLLFLIRGSLVYLMLGSFLALICALKLVLPSFCDGMSFLTYGRLFPAACDLLIYGWALPVGLALGLWLVARLSGSALRYTALLTSAIGLWNLGVFAGSLALLSGYSTSVPFLEYPNWASFSLFVAFLLMGLWVIFLLRGRQPRALYVSQWYLLAALCGFAWVYGTANLLLTWGNIEGSAQGPIQGWYVGSLMQLWFTPLALATSYYLIPKITGVAIHSYYLAIFGFFSLLLFSGWSGLSTLMGGPIPAWMSSAAVVANILLFLPMIAVVINFYQMLQQSRENVLRESPALRFIGLGIIFYVIATVLTLLNSFSWSNAILNFTDYTSGIFFVSLLGFFSMTAFGGLYYMLPRLTGISWSSSALIRWHFWLAVTGVSVMTFATVLGGMIEGFALNDSVITFVNVLSYAAPWRWLVSISWMILFAGFFCMIRLLGIMRWQRVEKNLPSV